MTFLTLLQIPTLGTAAADSAYASIPDSEKSIHLIDIISEGEPSMLLTLLVLLVLSIITVYILVERYMTLSRASKVSDTFISDIKGYVKSGDIDTAKEHCAKTDSPVAKMIGKGLSRIGSPMDTIEVAVENVGKIEINKLEKNLSIVATIAGAGPMIGFLGTVLGMIQAFMVMAHENVADISSMAGGIYEALLTTAAGLIVGVVAYIAYNYLANRMQKIVHSMEYNSIEFMDLLQEPNQ